MQRPKSTFSEYGHVAYQIKGNEMYNNMQSNVVLYTHPRPLGLGQKVKTFFPSESGHVAYQFKVNEAYNNM